MDLRDSMAARYKPASVPEEQWKLRAEELLESRATVGQEEEEGGGREVSNLSRFRVLPANF